MSAHLRPALVMIIAFTILTGIIYPLAMTGIAQIGLRSQANGSLVTRDGNTIGSILVGQNFAADKYFHGRSSAAGQNGYDATSSSGSNFGATSKKLIDRVTADVDKLRKAGATAIPGDSVTASASGLDPHISPAFAELQVDRVAKARNVAAERVRQLLSENTDAPLLGIIGEPRVNVFNLNLALDAALAKGPG